MLAEAAKNHMSTVLCSVDTMDWKQAGHTTTASTYLIINNPRKGYPQKHPIVDARREGQPRPGVAGELEPQQRRRRPPYGDQGLPAPRLSFRRPV
jgi:hypothetical protein